MSVKHKIFDNLFKNRLNIDFIKKSEFTNLIYDENYQIIDICPHRVWKKNHILFTINLTPTNFKLQYPTKLDKHKKILIAGNWHHNAYYYRLLKTDGYKVFLIK